MIEIGIERFLQNGGGRYRGARVALFTHLAAVDRELVPTVDRIATCDAVRLRAILTPEHGLYGVAQAGAHIADEVHPRYGTPIYSLYGERKQPTPEMLRDIDLILVDFQDLGVRFYTYISALGYVLEAAAEQGVPVLLCDRPNPLTGVRTEGTLVQPELISYVGRYRIPLRYGMTAGELARWMCRENGWRVDLEVLPVAGWSRAMWHEQTGREWVPPSPNMPTLSTAIVYPGLALFEGTNVSEGRGTTRPFETFGAPWMKAAEVTDAFHHLQLPGVRLRETFFVPTFSKHQGLLCRGAQVHVTDRELFRPLEAGMRLLQIVAALHPGEFRYTDPVNGRHFLDLLCGSGALRQRIEAGQDLTDIIKLWETAADHFTETVASDFLYN